MASNGYGFHSPGGYSLSAAFISEFAMNFMFLWIIMAGQTLPNELTKSRFTNHAPARSLVEELCAQTKIILAYSKIILDSSNRHSYVRFCLLAPSASGSAHFVNRLIAIAFAVILGKLGSLLAISYC
jgi:hypothetical protein